MRHHVEVHVHDMDFSPYDQSVCVSFSPSIYQVMLEELVAIVDGTKCRSDSYLVTVIPVVQHILFVVIDLQDAEDHKG